MSAESNRDLFNFNVLVRLQRGRARVSAESFMICSTISSTAYLQRGRARVSAESAAQKEYNAAIANLQRGRARVSAESTTAFSPSSARNAFNGAALG